MFLLVTAAHLAVFAWVGLRAPYADLRPPPPEPAMEVVLYRPPPPPRPSADAGRAAPVAPVPYRPRLVLPAAPANVESIPAPPSPGPPGRPAPPAPPAGPETSDGFRRTLRASPAGCANRDRIGMSIEERVACDQAFGRAAGRPPLPLDIAPEKRRGFDAAAAAKARNTREREGSMTQPMVACEGRASNFGVGCTPGR